jgi:hypothetical protein
MFELKNKPWWSFLDESCQELLLESEMLLSREQTMRTNFHDYAFIVFPAAKAYEGFLKKLFLEMGLIKEHQFEGRSFRIGKALNPSIDERSREDDDWIYDKLKDMCNLDLPEFLWETWKESRNLIFHWFPNHKNAITLDEARERLEMIIKAMDIAFEDCRIATGNK